MYVPKYKRVQDQVFFTRSNLGWIGCYGLHCVDKFCRSFLARKILCSLIFLVLSPKVTSLMLLSAAVYKKPVLCPGRHVQFSLRPWFGHLGFTIEPLSVAKLSQSYVVPRDSKFLAAVCPRIHSGRNFMISCIDSPWLFFKVLQPRKCIPLILLVCF